MAIQLDSTAVFQARVKQLGLEELWNPMQAQGWATWGEFSTSTTWIPGTPDNSDFKLTVLESLLGPPPAPVMAPEITIKYMVQSAKLKRLFVEAYTVFAADLQRRVARTDDDEKPRKLAKEERAARLEQVIKELGVLDLEDEPEMIPSHKVTDIFAAMRESGELRPLPWEESTTRDQERRAVKKTQTGL